MNKNVIGKIHSFWGTSKTWSCTGSWRTIPKIMIKVNMLNIWKPCKIPVCGYGIANIILKQKICKLYLGAEWHKWFIKPIALKQPTVISNCCKSQVDRCFKLVADKAKTIRSSVENRYGGEKIQTLQFCLSAGRTDDIHIGFDRSFKRLEILRRIPTWSNNSKSLILYWKPSITDPP